MHNPLEDPDVLLIQGFIDSKDPQNFNRLMDRYQDRVYNFCYRFLGNESDAADCSQEILIKVFKSLDRFEFRAKFSSWLYRISLNTCNEMVRSKEYRHRKNRVESEILNKEHHLYKNADVSKNFDPEVSLYRKQINEAFQNALDKMKTVHKTIIILRDIEGYSYEEIAKITGMKIGTVRSTLARARYKMAGQLKEFRNAM